MIMLKDWVVLIVGVFVGIGCVIVELFVVEGVVVVLMVWCVGFLDEVVYGICV